MTRQKKEEIESQTLETLELVAKIRERLLFHARYNDLCRFLGWIRSPGKLQMELLRE